MEKSIIVDGKFHQKVQVVMLTTDKQSTLFKKSSGLIEYNVCPPLHGVRDLGWEYQHLYFLSDEEIKDGDWYFNGKNVFKCDNLENVNPERYNYLKKIIATSDSSLKINNPNYDIGRLAYIPLPQPSKEFIESYVEDYNSGNIIKMVLVEVKPRYYRHKGLNVREDNTIIIRPLVQKTFTELEVVGFLRKYKQHFGLEIDSEQEFLFIQDNLKK